MKFNIKRKPKDLSVKEKPKDLIIKRNIIRTMWVYLIISLIITSGLYFERYLVEPYKYLLISPSF